MSRYYRPKKHRSNQYKRKQRNKKENILLILIDMIKDFFIFLCDTIKNIVKLVGAVTE